MDAEISQIFNFVHTDMCYAASYKFVSDESGNPISGVDSSLVLDTTVSLYVEPPSRMRTFNIWVEVSTV